VNTAKSNIKIFTALLLIFKQINWIKIYRK